MTQTRARQQAPQATVVEEEEPQDTSLMNVRAPWEKDDTLPEITFEYHQTERGRWFADRKVTINSLDPMTEEGTQAVFDVLERVDQIAREHMDWLYLKDAESREKWLAQREQQGWNGNQNWNDRR